ncbi:MAG: Asp/Glu racemase [Rhodanobacteraceae bacterium]|nr:MAG: Asp/Glu racemase [Rhodanobacteraceae bacterium]
MRPSMKKIGILGGIAWPSTVEYYAGLCRIAEQRHAHSGGCGPAAMPEMAIESLDLATATALLGRDDAEASWYAFDAYHREGLRRLQRSHAEFAVIACNTAHHRLVEITRGIDIPVLNILDVAAATCARLGIERVLILGTRIVMTSPFLRSVFLRRGIAACGPRRHSDRQATIAVIEALARGSNAGASRRIHDIVMDARTGNAPRSSAVYLGCTELPLAFAAHKADGVFESDGIRYINSTALHIQAAFEYAIRGS